LKIKYRADIFLAGPMCPTNEQSCASNPINGFSNNSHLSLGSLQGDSIMGSAKM
jgi:hypothetical protein